MVEFIPPQQTLEGWLEMTSIQTYPGLPEAQFVEALKANVEKKGVVFDSTQTPNGDTIIDFAMPDNDGVEYNIFRLHQSQTGSVSTLTIQQYAARFAGDLAAVKTKEFTRIRENLLAEMATRGLQVKRGD